MIKDAEEYKAKRACDTIMCNEWYITQYSLTSDGDQFSVEFASVINYGIDTVRYRLWVFCPFDVNDARCLDYYLFKMYRDFVERIPWYHLRDRFKYNGYRIIRDGTSMNIYCGSLVDMPDYLTCFISELLHRYAQDSIDVEMNAVINFFDRDGRENEY